MKFIKVSAKLIGAFVAPFILLFIIGGILHLIDGDDKDRNIVENKNNKTINLKSGTESHVKRVKYTPRIQQQNRLGDDQKTELVSDFCYALQASAICQDLNMRLDTEDKVESLVGGKFRAPDTPYTYVCMTAITRADSDESKGLCRLAWQQYGCQGTKMPSLLYKRDDFCKFNGQLANVTGRQHANSQ